MSGNDLVPTLARRIEVIVLFDVNRKIDQRGSHVANSARKRRRPRRHQRAVEHVPAYITRKIPYFDFLDEAALQRIEAQADWLLQDIGVEFRDDEMALQRLRTAGALIDGERVRFPDGLARELCASIPQQFTQYARNPANNVVIGGPNTVFAPNYGSPFVRDLDNGRRYGTLQDFQNFAKLTRHAKWLHHAGGTLVEPCDIPVNQRHLDMVYAHIKYSDKPYLGSITTKSRAEESIAMTKILFGKEFVDQHCCIMGNVNANSPLMFDKVATEAIEVYCGNGQGIIVAPFILGGAMGPVTTAAAVAQALAEGMAAGAYSQLVRRGAPFILGNFLSSMSLAAYESADSMHSTALAGANYVLHAAGWLEGGLTVGYEKFMLDVDRLGGLQRMLAGGLDTDENGLAASAYTEVEPGNHFLGCSHTMANYETAFYDAKLSDSESYEQWADGGSKDATQRASERCQRILREYEPPALDPAIDEELQDFIRVTKASREDMWY